MVNDFCNRLEQDFNNFSVCAFDLDARFCQRLSCFHAADDTAHACPVFRNDLDIIFAIQRLQGSESFGYFQD